MRASSGCAQEYYPGRRCLAVAAGASPPVSASASAQSLDAQRADLERALGVTTTVLFVASLLFIVLSTLYGCLCTGRPQQPDGDPGALPAAASAEETKRALEEIPVVVVQVRDDGDRGSEGGVEEEEAGECAVCLAEYAGGEEVRVLPACRHGFHRECVDRWLLTRAPTCPVCRAPIAARSKEPDAKCCAGGDAVLPVVP
ncbi:RING-H2 finger protein ATL66-like [Phragmites australis]|uniref:RING-H2 finger protein ATL66-like n=1 Tax=Phragmites australis TaxID=29695 RepID=UPI002D785F1B|nr:RING-H2 finger protein ATL66-like [Phragmites australis]